MISYTTNALRPATVGKVPPAMVDDSETWLKATGMRIDAARDAALFNQGDDAHSCYRIVSGAVRLCKVMADGRRHVVDFMLPGDFIGLDSGSTYAFTAEAIVETVLIRYARPQVRMAIESDARASRRLLEFAMSHLLAAQGQALLLGRMNARERVATFLLNLQRRLGGSATGTRVVPLAMTRADIADHLGLTLETVSRMLNDLKRRGVIDLPHPHEIHIRNRQALESLASDLRH